MSYQGFNYGVTGSTRMGMQSHNPWERAQAQDAAFGYQKDHDREMFERNMMQQEQNRRSNETQMQGQAMNKKYSLLGGLLGR